MSPIVPFRVSNLLGGLCLLLTGVFTHPQAGRAQVRISPMAAWDSASRSTAHPEDQTPTTLAINLCVDGSAIYPLPKSRHPGWNLRSSHRLITYGQILNGVAAYGPPTLDTGTITLYKDTTAVCTLVLGVNFSCPPASTIFDVGNYTLTATLTFPPGSLYAESSAAPVVVSVAKDPTTIAVAGSPNPAAFGTPVTFTAAVSGEYPATPTGQVVFTLDGSQLPPIPLGGTGTATVTISTLALGTHTVTASYAGALDFLPATDAQTTETIVPPATVTTIASSPESLHRRRERHFRFNRLSRFIERHADRKYHLQGRHRLARDRTPHVEGNPERRSNDHFIAHPGYTQHHRHLLRRRVSLAKRLEGPDPAGELAA